MFINKDQLRIIVLGFFFVYSNANSATAINLRHQLPTALSNFIIAPKLKDKASNLIPLKEDIDFNRTSHIKIQQTYNGYPVWGGNAIFHIPYQKRQAIKLRSPLASVPASMKMNGTIFKNLDSDLSNAPPYIFNEQQSKKAQDFIVHHYLSPLNNNKVVHTNTKMIVYIEQGKAHWAFKSDFLVMKPKAMPARPTYIIDALSFAEFKHWDEMRTLTTREEPDQPTPNELSEAKGGGMGGNLNGIIVYDGLRGNKSSLYIKRDDSKNICYFQNDNVIIKNYQFDFYKWAYTGDVIQYNCDAPDPKHNNVYWNGMTSSTKLGFSPPNDAMYAATLVNEVYQSLYNVPVLDREDMDHDNDDDEPSQPKININLHADGFLENNAAYDPFANELIIGDGDNKLFYPLTSLDVIAHELSHGFTHRYAGLVNDGQSAGLGESFSDMAAQVMEFADSQRNTWKIGSRILVDNDGGKKALRYMDNPRRDCVGRANDDMCSIDNLKYYYDALDSHFSCGIFNKAFYLLSTSPNWNVRKAFDVMVQANMHYWVPNTDFMEAACGVIDAGRDYGYELEAIKQAFAGVGINTEKC